jgi:hypothetical protein
MLHVQLGTDLGRERTQANQLRSERDRRDEHRRERTSVAPGSMVGASAHAGRAIAIQMGDEVGE